MSQGCHDKAPQTGALRQQKPVISQFPSLGFWNLVSAGRFLGEVLGDPVPGLFLASGGSGSPCCPSVCGHITPVSACHHTACLPAPHRVCVFSQDTGRWIRAPPSPLSPQPHLITPGKPLFPSKVTLKAWGLGLRHNFLGTQFNPHGFRILIVTWIFARDNRRCEVRVPGSRGSPLPFQSSAVLGS